MTRISIFRLTILCSLFFIHCSLLPALSLEETLNTLRTICPDNSIQFRWDPLFRSGTIKSGDHYGSFLISRQEGESGYLLVDNRELFNVPMPYNKEGALVFPGEFVSVLSGIFTRLHENDEIKFRVSTIIIDPGHGGRDPGTIGYMAVNGKTVSIYEKDIVLKVGLALRDQLIKKYPNKRIMMTRDTDIHRTLEQRADMANAVTVKANEAVIFISIHANWGSNPNARGYEVWHITSGNRRPVMKPSMQDNYPSDIQAILNAMLEEEYKTESILLANYLLSGFEGVFGNTLPSRGRKANDWFVVKNSRMPAVLVELGFVSNIQDAQIMTGSEGLQKLTRSLYNGITNYISTFEHE